MTTSAGVGTTGYSLSSNKSPCQSKSGGTQTGRPGVSPHKQTPGDIKNDEVSRDKIWRQSVENETRGLKNWEENWGFLAELDEKGLPKSPPTLPDHVPTYSDNVPNTSGANYGGRLNTEEGKMMQNLEFQFYSNKRRRKMGGEMICY